MAEHVEHAPSNSGRAARSASSRRRSPAPSADTDAAQPADAQAGAPMLDLFDKDPEPALEHEAAGAAQDSQAAPGRENAAEPTADAVSADGKPNDSGDPVTARAQDEALEPAVASGSDAPEPHEPAGTQVSAVPASDLTEPQEQGEAIATIVALAATQADAPPQPAATAAPKQPEPSPEPLAGALASGHSYAPTSATGNTARMISAVHAADLGPVVHSEAPERATAVLPADIVAAISAQTAAQTRRTKWMLTAAVAALVVTAGVAIAQTLLLASLSADATAQQQRLDVLMQNQQTALDNMASRLAALTAGAPAAAVAAATATAATGAAREAESPTPPRRPARAAKTPKSTEKAATHTTGSKSSRTHTQSPTRQAAAKN